LAALTLLLSPTRFAIERFKRIPIRTWNIIFRGIAIAMLTALLFANDGMTILHLPLYLGYIGLWLFPFSRINELVLAFYRDAFQRFDDCPNRRKITALDRLRFLVFSYFETAIQFGILYFSLPHEGFSRAPASIVEAVYFSAVTITTAGYGDIVPIKWWSQLACMYELAAGFILIVFALGSYLATTKSTAAESE
jgi:hypothetical protein